MLGQLGRFVRQKDAPSFFAVSRGKFNADIRPHLRCIHMGKTPQSGIVYDIFDLHALADMMKERNGRPAKKGEISWDVNIENPDYTSSKDPAPNPGMFKAHSSANELDRVLKLSREKRQKLSKQR
jgi:hypothetical protein